MTQVSLLRGQYLYTQYCAISLWPGGGISAYGDCLGMHVQVHSYPKTSTNGLIDFSTQTLAVFFSRRAVTRCMETFWGWFPLLKSWVLIWFTMWWVKLHAGYNYFWTLGIVVCRKPSQGDAPFTLNAMYGDFCYDFNLETQLRDTVW